MSCPAHLDGNTVNRRFRWLQSVGPVELAIALLEQLLDQLLDHLEELDVTIVLIGVQLIAILPLQGIKRSRLMPVLRVHSIQPSSSYSISLYLRLPFVLN